MLKYPEPLGLHPQVTYEMAVQYLVKAHQLAAQYPFQFGYIDKPPDGSLFMIFLLPQQRVFPNDGVRYQEQETRYNIPAGGNRVSTPSDIYFRFVHDLEYRNWKSARPSLASFRIRTTRLHIVFGDVSVFRRVGILSSLLCIIAWVRAHVSI